MPSLCHFRRANAPMHTTVFGPAPHFASDRSPLHMSLSESEIAGAAARAQLKDAVAAFACHSAKAEGFELSQQSIAAIQASAVNFARNLTGDVEMFARHRGARTISTADLKMALRKSEALTNCVRVTEAAFAENMLNPQAPRAAASDGSRKRGRPPKIAAANAASAVESAAAALGSTPAAIASAFAQSASDNFDMLPQDSTLPPPPPKFKSFSRIVRPPTQLVQSWFQLESSR
jgi:histone H3/H4